jgi:hypothetical protein
MASRMAESSFFSCLNLLTMSAFSLSKSAWLCLSSSLKLLSREYSRHPYYVF